MKEIAQKVQRLMREKESQFLKDLHWFHENPEMKAAGVEKNAGAVL